MNTEVISIEAEEIPIEKAVEKSFLTSLEKHEINKKMLEEKRDECLALKLNGQDKEAYILIRETRLNQKTNRVVIEKICKKGREDATKTQKAWIAMEKDYVKIVSEGEDYLSRLEEEFESEQERIKQEAKRKQEEAFIIRQAFLTKLGATYQEGYFVLNDVSYEAVLIKESDNEVWETMRSKFNEQYLINEEKRIADEKLKEEAAALLESQRQEQERKRIELEEREAAIKKKEQEELDRQRAIENQKAAELKAKMDAQNKSRSNQLAALGLNYNGQEYTYQDINVHWVDITTYSESEWNELIKKITPEINNRKQEAEKKRLAAIEEEKRIAAELAVKKEKERVVEENMKAEEKRLQEEAKKAEEALKATDKTKWAAVLKYIEAIQFPEMKHHTYKQKVVDAKKLISKITDL
jgi:hypothetical protein